MEFGTTVARRLKPSGATAVCTAKLAVLHGKLKLLRQLVILLSWNR